MAKAIIDNMEVIGSKPHIVFDILFLRDCALSDVKVCALNEVAMTW